MRKPSVAIVRGKFLNRFEMQSFELLTTHFDITAFGSRAPIHDRYAFPVMKLPSPMDVSFGAGSRVVRPVLNRLFVDAHYLFGLEERLKRFDLVHTAETYFHYTQQALNAKAKGYVKKVIATVWETIVHNNEGVWGRRYYKIRAIRELDHIVAVTNRAKHALIEEGANARKITVIPPGIDTKRFTPHVSRQKPFTVLFVGRLELEKGVEDLLAVRCSLPKSIRWCFVGDGSYKTKILSQGLSVTSVSYDRMPEIYHEADLFVAPSKPTKTWEEQYGIALMEAQASGLPIVTTNTGGIPENVGNAAVIVSPGDVPTIARAILEFMRSQDKRRLYSKRSRMRAEAVHDIRIAARKMKQLYQQVLDV